MHFPIENLKNFYLYTGNLTKFIGRGENRQNTDFFLRNLLCTGCTKSQKMFLRIHARINCSIAQYTMRTIKISSFLEFVVHLGIFLITLAHTINSARYNLQKFSRVLPPLFPPTNSSLASFLCLRAAAPHKLNWFSIEGNH